jgi:hypothetical protein
MKRFFAIFATLLAVFAISVPSFAAGARGFVPHPAPLVLQQASGAYIKAPCALGGSSRLIGCSTELGLLPGALLPLLAKGGPARDMRDDSVRQGIASLPHKRPPRSA